MLRTIFEFYLLKKSFRGRAGVPKVNVKATFSLTGESLEQNKHQDFFRKHPERIKTIPPPPPLRFTHTHAPPSLPQCLQIIERTRQMLEKILFNFGRRTGESFTTYVEKGSIYFLILCREARFNKTY